VTPALIAVLTGHPLPVAWGSDSYFLTYKDSLRGDHVGTLSRQFFDALQQWSGRGYPLAKSPGILPQ
jgi:hypothetical protein